MAKVFEFYHNADFDGRSSPRDGAIKIGRYEGDEKTATERLKMLRAGFGYSETSSKVFFDDKGESPVRTRAILDFSLSVDLDRVPGLCHDAKDFEEIVRVAIKNVIGNYNPELTLIRIMTRNPVEDIDGYRVPRSAVEMSSDAEAFPDCTMREYLTADDSITCTYCSRNSEFRWFRDSRLSIKRITQEEAQNLLGGHF